MPTPTEKFGQALWNNAAEFGIQLRAAEVTRLSKYYELLLKWNDRLHLVAPCSPEEFATRHVLESLLLLSHLPQKARVLDVGSGAGLPIIPCLMIRTDLSATLIESSPRKAVFLREALRDVSNREPAALTVARFEQTTAPEADFVTCRALDRFQRFLPALIQWAPPTSTLLLFAGEELRKQLEILLPNAKAERIPRSDRRYLIVASQASAG
ncbi:MAG TPA: 16S rRNA (guanine(527)-N(7))-methyltransferase RsmG [Pyrinomonadaceae bacterium]|nr:16S rRNA (guanine(527)-N(7))-methyltransferase RsmG [Pyrinomonadaceae bacterium]